MGQAFTLARRNAATESPASAGEYDDDECEMPRFSSRTGSFNVFLIEESYYEGSSVLLLAFFYFK